MTIEYTNHKGEKVTKTFASFKEAWERLEELNKEIKKPSLGQAKGK